MTLYFIVLQEETTDYPVANDSNDQFFRDRLALFAHTWHRQVVINICLLYCSIKLTNIIEMRAV